MHGATTKTDNSGIYCFFLNFIVHLTCVPSCTPVSRYLNTETPSNASLHCQFATNIFSRVYASDSYTFQCS